MKDPASTQRPVSRSGGGLQRASEPQCARVDREAKLHMTGRRQQAEDGRWVPV